MNLTTESAAKPVLSSHERAGFGRQFVSFCTTKGQVLPNDASTTGVQFSDTVFENHPQRYAGNALAGIGRMRQSR